jgi:KAP family P-loop domain
MAVAGERGAEPIVRQTQTKKASPDETAVTAPDPAEGTPRPPSAGQWLYADTHLVPGDKDSLGLGAYANALALLMDTKETRTPLTIAINGPWGSGKTSLAKMAEARLPIGSDWNKPHITCWFDAWANDDAPHLGAAFAAAVARAVNKERPLGRRLLWPLPSAMLSP